MFGIGGPGLQDSKARALSRIANVSVKNKVNCEKHYFVYPRFELYIKTKDKKGDISRLFQTRCQT